MSFLQWLLLATIIFGHLGIWCALYNQVHATAWPRPTRKLIEMAMYAAILLLAIALLAHSIRIRSPLSSTASLVFAYQVACLAAAAFFSVRWVIRKLTEKTPTAFLNHKFNFVDLGARFQTPPIHGVQARILNAIPGNQIFQLAIEQKTIGVKRLPPAFDGIKIAHLSDLHLTGKIGKPFFELIVQQCNELDPDLVFLTGDVVDKEPCIDWLPDILGNVVARIGRYYILGNHDRRVHDTDYLRQKIQQSGFTRAVGQWNAVTIDNHSIWLLGNETPWFTGSSMLPTETEDPNSTTATDPNAVRLLLAHTPDLISWAHRHYFDLMFAGHCHGGQIRIPMIGPIISPSRHGVRFASGVFQIRGTTLMVTRGISSDDPIRLNCRPELSLITLKKM